MSRSGVLDNRGRVDTIYVDGDVTRSTVEAAMEKRYKKTDNEWINLDLVVRIKMSNGPGLKEVHAGNFQTVRPNSPIPTMTLHLADRTTEDIKGMEAIKRVSDYQNPVGPSEQRSS